MVSFSVCLSLPAFLVVTVSSDTCWQTHQRNHRPVLPAPRLVNYLAHCLGAEQPLQPLLAPLLTTRVPDTEGNSNARDYIMQVLGDLGWSLELDSFSQDTVIGEKTFHNIIATRNRDSPRRLGTDSHHNILVDYFINVKESLHSSLQTLTLPLTVTPASAGSAL